jgi:hypothetical protein
MAAVSFLAGVFIDLDHLIDYWRECPGRIEPSHFFAICNEVRLKKVWLWLHSLELLPVLGLVLWCTRSWLVAGVLLGFAQHLLLDAAGNPGRPAAYLLFYRMRKKFRTADILTAPQEQSGRTQE